MTQTVIQPLAIHHVLVVIFEIKFIESCAFLFIGGKCKTILITKNKKMYFIFHLSDYQQQKNFIQEKVASLVVFLFCE
jgi:hypothetical protein